MLEIFHSLKDKSSITKIQKRLKIDYSIKLNRAIIRKILNKNGLKMNIYKKKAKQKITDLSVQNHSFAKSHFRNEEDENSARMHLKYAKSFSNDVSESDVNFSLDYHYNGKSKKSRIFSRIFRVIMTLVKLFSS